MFKLLFTLGVFLILALALLGIRTHTLELTAETARLRQQVTQREQQLWGQEIPITQQTNPMVLVKRLEETGMVLQNAEGPAATRSETSHVDTDRDLTAPLRRRGSTSTSGRTH